VMVCCTGRGSGFHKKNSEKLDSPKSGCICCCRQSRAITARCFRCVAQPDLGAHGVGYKQGEMFQVRFVSSLSPLGAASFIENSKWIHLLFTTPTLRKAFLVASIPEQSQELPRYQNCGPIAYPLRQSDLAIGSGGRTKSKQSKLLTPHVNRSTENVS
jgi:hypothetical protein